MRYVLYEIQSGMIIQSGSCPDESCLPEKPDGAEFIFGAIVNPDTHLIQDGVAVLRIQTQERSDDGN